MHWGSEKINIYIHCLLILLIFYHKLAYLPYPLLKGLLLQDKVSWWYSHLLYYKQYVSKSGPLPDIKFNQDSSYFQNHLHFEYQPLFQPQWTVLQDHCHPSWLLDELHCLLQNLFLFSIAPWEKNCYDNGSVWSSRQIPELSSATILLQQEHFQFQWHTIVVCYLPDVKVQRKKENED